jgi:putative flippase GtrA
MLKLINDIQRNSDYGIVVVNDGSAEKCNEIFDKAAEAGCIVLKHEVNRGKGAALKTAFTYLAENQVSDGFICADCDGQHSWTDIKKLADELASNPGCVLLGCRKFVGKVPLKSMFGNKITRFIFSLITGTKITDTQTGLRAFSAPMLPWLVKLNGNRYEYEMNQLLEAKKAGYNLFCIPIETIYENNNEGSHFNPVMDSIRIYLPILKFSMSSITCGAIDFILLFLLQCLTDNLLFAVVGARVVSSLCNYILNKQLVFKTKAGRKVSTLIQYYLLVAAILGMNYLLISFLSETLAVPLVISKILTEAILFSISYAVQHKVIFKKKA